MLLAKLIPGKEGHLGDESVKEWLKFWASRLGSVLTRDNYHSSEEDSQIAKDKTSLNPGDWHLGLVTHSVRLLIINIRLETFFSHFLEYHLAGFNNNVFLPCLAGCRFCLVTSKGILVFGKRCEVLLVFCLGLILTLIIQNIKRSTYQLGNHVWVEMQCGVCLLFGAACQEDMQWVGRHWNWFGSCFSSFTQAEELTEVEERLKRY